VTVLTGPLTQGWQAAAPYDVILLNGATEIVPHGLARQLKEGGRFVAVLCSIAALPAMPVENAQGRATPSEKSALRGLEDNMRPRPSPELCRMPHFASIFFIAFASTAASPVNARKPQIANSRSKWT
jgi:hypothetical protein